MANEAQIAMLKQGAEAWNQWLKENAEITLDLSGAGLSEANLNYSSLHEATFGDTNLQNTFGLDSCYHHGPSIIDHRTIERSGNIPEVFLLGCGLPDSLLDYLPSLLNQPVQYYSIFIRYSSQDNEIARRLHNDLQASGVRCWLAPEDIKIGGSKRITIDEQVYIQDISLLLVSKYSTSSDWVEQEIKSALDKERKQKDTVLFLIHLDNAVMEAEAGRAADNKLPRCKQTGYLVPDSRKAPIDGHCEASDSSHPVF